MLAKRVGMMYSTTMTNEQPTLIEAGKQIKNDAGSSESGLNENLDCTIRALSASSGIQYEVAHKIGKDAGRKDRHRFNVPKLIKEAKKNGLKYYKVIRSTITVNKFLQKYSKGRFYCVRRGHAFAVVDGVILDTTYNTPFQIITEAYEFIQDAEDSSCQTALDYVI